ncbi:hypothetical protein C0995_003721 [Termitomyces sp. Mi166|nr:hypothetical protein C0995_003721 [Termitomyces sp. Mi166\
MAYPHYTPPAGTHPPTSTTYPYGAYHPTHAAYAAHPQTPGAYSYTPSAYQTGVTSYGWPYPYPWPPPTQQAHAPTSTTTPVTTTASTHSPATPTVAQVPPKPTTFTSYTPSYMRESVVAASSGGATGRGSRKQSTRGLFTKEREQPVIFAICRIYVHDSIVKSIMYGFGDDRNPANDTCASAGNSSRKTRLSIDDLRRALSRPADAKKLARMEELLFMQEDIKRARAQFDDNTNPTEF